MRGQRCYTWTAPDFAPSCKHHVLSQDGHLGNFSSRLHSDVLQTAALSDGKVVSTYSVVLELDQEAIYRYPLLQSVEKMLRHQLSRYLKVQVYQDPHAAALLHIVCDANTLAQHNIQKTVDAALSREKFLFNSGDSTSVGSKGPSSQSYRGNMALLAWICSLRCSRFAPPFDVFNGEPLLAVAVATGAVLNVRCRIHPFAFPVDHSFGTFCNWSRFKLSFRVTSYDVVPRLAEAISPWVAYGCGLEMFIRSSAAIVFLLLIIINSIVSFLQQWLFFETTMTSPLKSNFSQVLRSCVIMGWCLTFLSPRAVQLPFGLPSSLLSFFSAEPHAAHSCCTTEATSIVSCSIIQKFPNYPQRLVYLDLLVSSIPVRNGLLFNRALQSPTVTQTATRFATLRCFCYAIANVMSCVLCTGFAAFASVCVVLIVSAFDHPATVVRSLNAALLGVCPSSPSLAEVGLSFASSPTTSAQRMLLTFTRRLLRTSVKSVILAWILAAHQRTTVSSISILSFSWHIMLVTLAFAWGSVNLSSSVLLRWIVALRSRCFAWFPLLESIPTTASPHSSFRIVSFFTDFEVAVFVVFCWNRFNETLRTRSGQTDLKHTAVVMVNDIFVLMCWIIACLWNPHLPMILLVAGFTDRAVFQDAIAAATLIDADILTATNHPAHLVSSTHWPFSVCYQHPPLPLVHLWDFAAAGFSILNTIGFFSSLFFFLPPLPCVILCCALSCVITLCLFHSTLQLTFLHAPLHAQVSASDLSPRNIRKRAKSARKGTTGVQPLMLDDKRLRTAANLLIAQPNVSLAKLSAFTARQQVLPRQPTSKECIDKLSFLNRFLGTWKLLRDKSDSMDPISKALGVSWAIRRIMDQFVPSCQYERLDTTTLRITTFLPMKQKRSLCLYVDSQEHCDQDGELGSWVTITKQEQPNSAVLVSHRRRERDGVHLVEKRQICTQNADPSDMSSDVLWYYVEIRLSGHSAAPVVASSNRYFQRLHGPPESLRSCDVVSDPSTHFSTQPKTESTSGGVLEPRGSPLLDDAVVPLIQSLDELPPLSVTSNMNAPTSAVPTQHAAPSSAPEHSVDTTYVETVCTSVVCTSTTRRQVFGAWDPAAERREANNTRNLTTNQALPSLSVELPDELKALAQCVTLEAQDVSQLVGIFADAKRCTKEVALLSNSATDPNTLKAFLILTPPANDARTAIVPNCNISLSWESQLRTEKLQIDRLILPQQQPVGRGSIIFKTMLTVPEILDYLFNPAWLKTVDSAIDKAFCMYAPSPDVIIAYQSYYGGMGFSGREFVYIGTRALTRHKKAGTIGVMSLHCPSLETKHQSNFSANYVRGTLLRCGFHVKRLNDENEHENTIRLCYLTQVDAKTSSIPRWLVNVLQLAQLRRIVNIQNQLAVMETREP